MKRTNYYSGFDPTMIPNCTLWLDGTRDLSGNRWLDRSASSNNATRTAGTIASTTVNGRQAFSFSNVTMTYDASQIFNGTTGSSMFIMFSAPVRANGHLVRTSLGGVGNHLIWDNRSLFENIGYSSRQQIALQFLYNTVQLYTNIANRGGNTLIFRNGAQVSSIAYGSGYTSVNYEVGGTETWSGTVCDILVYTRTLSLAEQQQVEGYLSRKWLPSRQNPLISVTHPYSTGPPIGFSPTNISNCTLWLDGTSGVSGGVWTDKSTSSNNATSNAGTITTTTVNDISALSFSNVRMRYTTRNIFNGTTGSSVFFVFSAPSNTNGHLLNTQLGGLNNHLLWTDANNYENIGFNSRQTVVGFSHNTLQLYANIANRSSNTIIFRDGSQLFSTTYGSNYTSLNYDISGSSWTGTVCDILVYTRTLTLAEQQDVEGYLAWKWASAVPPLPTTHPYVSIPPVLRPFSPIDVPDCLVWLDGADRSCVDVSGTSNVTLWRDKSGNGRNFSTTAGTPTYANQTVTFPSGAIMTSATDISLTSNTYAFAVARLGSADSNIRMMLGFSGILSGDFSIRYNSNLLNGVPNRTGTSNDFGNSNYFVNGVSQPSLAESNYSVRHMVSGQSVNAGGSTAVTLSSSFSSRFFIGDIHEVLLYGSVPSTTRRQQVEGYLTSKWGLSSIMPVGHPYRFSLPALTVGFTPASIPDCVVWLDAADLPTVTLSGSNVTQWRTKTGNVNFTRISGSAGPVLSNGGLYFTGSNSGLLNGSNVQTTQAATFLWVSSYVGEGTGPRRTEIDQRKDAAGIALRTFYYDQWQIRDTASRLQTSPTFSVASNTRVIKVWRDQVNLGQGYLNGTLNWSATGTYTQQVADSNSIRLGQHFTEVGGAIYTLFELIVVNRYMSDLEFQQVEGYLAYKWGLVSNLPVNHPYRLTKP